MLRHLIKTSLFLALAFAGCSENNSDEPAVALSSSMPSNFDMNMQLSDKDRIPQAEKIFLDKIKEVIKNGDSTDFKRLYYLDNANPEYIAMIPYIFNKKWAQHHNDIDISIEPNQKAKKYNTYFTVPYLGDLVIKSISGKSIGTTKVPVGIKDGVYYITIGAKR